jgi:hypothetical protein
MPNHIYNKLTITGDNEILKQFVNDIRGDEETIDFEKLYPIASQNWYDWCVKHWSTKWNAYEIDNDWIINNRCQTIKYQTAWSPPINFYLHVSKMYPTLEFKQEYVDEGGNFVGDMIIINGQIIKQNDYQWNSSPGITLRSLLDPYYKDENEDENDG